MSGGARLPGATYRLQLGAQLRFADAALLVPYLAELGVTDVYLSPILAARKGSSHGYDVTDPSRVSPELGGEQALRGLLDAAKRHGMGVLVDIVPNHMAASAQNPWWRDVLANGRASRHAGAFDIDWAPPWPGGQGRVLAPILGDHYGRALESSELRVDLAPGGFVVRYFDHELPLDPGTCLGLVEPGLDDLALRLPATHPVREVFAEIRETLREVPPRDGPEAQSPAGVQRRRAGEVAVAALFRLCELHVEARDHVRRNLHRVNGHGGQVPDLGELDALLRAQAYRLSTWKTAAHEVNYRRFFNIADLAGVRAEEPLVREAQHDVILGFLREGLITGLRIDHIDGLADPRGYLQWLSDRMGEVGAPGYLVVEKILTGDEELPRDWPVAGTTGYDFLNRLNGVYVDPAGLAALDAIYYRFTGIAGPFETVAYECQRYVINHLLPAEMERVERELALLACDDRHGFDVASRVLRDALVEVTACLPVYRTYITGAPLDPTDRRRVLEAFALARERNPAVEDAAYDLLRRVLLLELPGREQDCLRFVKSWQQLTPPVVAKGLEDTSLYVYNRLISLNTVGGEPDPAEVSVKDFHHFVAARFERWPGSMNATATHDSKRGEDVRARISVLSEMPGEWEEHLRRFRAHNEGHKIILRGEAVPDPNEEVLLYQTLLGAWPLLDADLPDLVERLRGHLVKSAREAKERTSWREPDLEHERALVAFAERILERSPDNAFIDDFRRLERRVAFYGALNGLSQLLLKLAAPGVPDLYQGTELWSLTLVDPDNRRPVDFELRRRWLAEMTSVAPDRLAELAAELLRSYWDGRIKLLVTHRGLRARGERRELFQCGTYEPLHATGARRPNVCAFARRLRSEVAVAIAPRRMLRVVRPEVQPVGRAVWGESVLPLWPDAPPVLRNVLTEERVHTSWTADRPSIPLAEALRTLPVALLVSDEG